jgi:hypothetical protein
VEANDTDLLQLPIGRLDDNSPLGLVPAFLNGGDELYTGNLSVILCAYDLTAALKLERLCSGLTDPDADNLGPCLEKGEKFRGGELADESR